MKRNPLNDRVGPRRRRGVRGPLLVALCAVLAISGGLLPSGAASVSAQVLPESTTTSTPAVEIGLLLLAAGVALVTVVRRRRNSASTDPA